MDSSEYMAAVKADPRYRSFSVEKVEPSFRHAGFTRVPKEQWAWGGEMPGMDGPAACFDRNGVWVVAHWLGFEVSAPGDGSPLAGFPEAEMAIRFVHAFEQDAELMAADKLSDAQFKRAQLLVGQVFEEFEQELKDTLKRLREWLGFYDENDEDGTGPDPRQA